MTPIARLRRTAFIALMAMLMVVFAPTASKLLITEGVGAHGVEVCTTEGTKWISVSELGPAGEAAHHPDPSSGSEHGGDCPYCSLQTAQFISPSAQSFAATHTARALPPLFYRAPAPLFAWAHSRSRAPPRISI